MLTGVRKRGDEAADFLGERVAVGVVSGVQPPDFALTLGCRERMEHGQYRGGSDTRGHQHDRRRVVHEVEVAARRGRVDDGSGVDVGVQPAAHLAVRLAFDADPVLPTPVPGQ